MPLEIMRNTNYISKHHELASGPDLSNDLTNDVTNDLTLVNEARLKSFL